MANYKENFASKLDWAMPFQRTGAFPLDRSNLFETLADAQLYAQGGADKRGLGGTSYIGQMIVVYENDVVTAYIINADRSLKEMASTASDGSSVQSVLDALNAHKAAYDAKVKELENADKANAKTITDEVTRAKAAEKTNSDAIAVLNGDENTEGSVAKAVKVEADRAKAAEKVNAEAVAAEKTRAEGEEARIEGLVTAEVTRATNAEKGLSDKINIINGEANVEGSIKKAVADAEKNAKSYTDTKIANLVNSAPETLDTLKELADALGNDANFATTVTNKIAEKTDKTYVDEKLGEKANTSDVNIELAKKVDKVEGSRLVSTEEIAKWNTKAEVSDVTQALADAKSYTNEKVGDLTSLATDAKGSAVLAINELKGKIDGINEDLGATGSIGTRLNNLETTVGDAQSGLVKDVATNANNITTNTNAIAAINDTKTGILAQAKEDATTKADAAKNAAIAAAETKAGELDAALQTKIESDEGKLMTAIKAEVTRATEAENSLSGKIDIINGEGEGSFKKAITDEKTARENADKTLGDRIAKFEANGENDVSKLKTDLANEVARAKAAEESNANAIAAEAELRKEADDALDGRLDSIEGVVGNAEKGLVKDVATNTADITAIKDEQTGILAKANRYTDTAVANLVNSAPEALDTLQELANALGDDPNFATTVATQIGTKVDKVEGSRLVSAEEIAKWNAKAEVSDVTAEKDRAEAAELELKNAIGAINNANTGILAEAKKYADQKDSELAGNYSGGVDGEGNPIQAKGLRGEIETKIATEKTRAEGVEAKLREDVDKKVDQSAYNTKVAALEKADTDNLAAAKKYADDQDIALHTIISSEIDTDVAAEAKLRSDADTALSNRIANKADKEHGNHVPETQTVSNKVFLRNDNTWAEVTPANIGAAATNHGTHVEYATEHPKAPGTAAAGTSKKVAREDHVHPSQTTITGNAGTATKLATARTITVKGDATGSVSFDGSADKDLNLTLSNSGVSTGSYGPTGDVAPNYEETFVVPQVTVDIKGRVTSATNRTITLPAQIVYENATSSKAGLMSNEDKAKLDGIEANANNYTHPKSHPASMIVQDETHRFVNDDEKADWNARETTEGAQSKADTAAANALKDAKTYADKKVSDLVDGAPETLDTLKELADALSTHEGAYNGLLEVVGKKADKTYVDTELGKKVDKVEGSRLVTTAEVAKWDAKAEVSQVNQALSDAKDYTNGEIAKITTGDGSIGARLTAVETKNTQQDTAITNNATNLTEEINRAKAAEKVLTDNLAAEVTRAKAAEEANARAISTNATNITNNKSVLDKLDGEVTTEGSVKKQIKDAIDGITTGDGSIGTRLTAVEAKNTAQDEAITNAQNQANKGVTDAAAEKTRAEAAEKVLTDNLAAEVTRAKAAEKTNSDAISVNSNAITTNSNAIAVLNGDSTIEGSVDKKIADNNIFDTDILTVNSLGGIKAGENLNGMTIEEVLKKLLYPYVAHLVSASSSPDGGVFERGSTQTVTKITATITKKSEPITKVEFVDDSTVLETKTDGVADGGSVIHNCSITVSTNKSFTVKVTDKAGKTVTATTKEFNFVYPYYWGVCANDAAIDEAMVKGLTKKVETKGSSKGVTYTANFQRAVIAYPASYGNIKKILDPNSFDVTATFTKHSINVTGLDGKSVAYYVYVNGAFTATNFKFTFSY